MENTAKLLSESLKSLDALQNIEFKISGQDFKFYYRYLTMLEQIRIKQMCVKTTEVINADGSKKVTHEEQEHLYPIYCILEKALDENGKRLFSCTNKDNYNTIISLPSGVASFIAYQMSQDIFGTLKGDSNGE